jgi:hypothetical protein
MPTERERIVEEAMAGKSKREDVLHMVSQLNAADALARAVDEAVSGGFIGSRSKIADARLDYGEPFKYVWSLKP